MVELVGRAAAASILGITVRELDRLVDIFELSEKFTGLREPGAGITWARELMGVSKKLVSPAVIDAVVKKVSQKRITNSKDLRKLRVILRDPVAHANFLSEGGDLDTASLRLPSVRSTDEPNFIQDLETALDAMERVPWTTLNALKGDADVLRSIDKAQQLLTSMRKSLAS